MAARRARHRASGTAAALLLLAACGDEAGNEADANRVDPALANAVTPLPPEPVANLAAPEASMPGIDAPPVPAPPPPDSDEPDPAAEAQQTGTTVHTRYRCDDGTFVDAKFNADANTVKLRREGRVLGVLDGQPAASGIWYRGKGYELRGKGRDATFIRPGAAPVHCLAD
ncbi:MliC family protein [Sphingomonas baiyangensis]|uniref:C-type lysozyme inhibitor domain-containing protein n=1 Tax=Sphingomonas baiyangensis TaxID=2572576 RepID=A0A4U1L7I4_9SPHN|nr:MliC family protein [Sphingomonas baiyangensis]TKD52917.1 hypothetical protein FBR43_00765 [Sphingomonas baiyangensis]